MTAETGLSLYFDLGDRPTPEVMADEKDDKGRTHYNLVKEHFRIHGVSDYDGDPVRER